MNPKTYTYCSEFGVIFVDDSDLTLDSQDFLIISQVFIVASKLPKRLRIHVAYIEGTKANRRLAAT